MFSYLGTEYPNILIVSREAMPTDIPSDATFCEFDAKARLKPHEALVEAALDDPTKTVVIVCENELWTGDATFEASSVAYNHFNPFHDDGDAVDERAATTLETPFGPFGVTDSSGNAIEFAVADFHDTFPLFDDGSCISHIIESEGLHCAIVDLTKLEVGKTYRVHLDGPRLKVFRRDGGTTVLGAVASGRTFALSALDPNSGLDFRKPADRAEFVGWHLQLPKGRTPNGFSFTLLDHRAPEMPIFFGWVEGTGPDAREAIENFVIA
jgi:hypothetical protein